jgi:hypothetical protein
MTYLDRIAGRIHWEGWCLEHEMHHCYVPPGEGEMPLYRIYAVLARSGCAVTSEEVHDAWVAWQAGVRPDHWYLVPFEELPDGVKAQDAVWAQAINIVAGTT